MRGLRGLVVNVLESAVCIVTCVRHRGTKTPGSQQTRCTVCLLQCICKCASCLSLWFCEFCCRRISRLVMCSRARRVLLSISVARVSQFAAKIVEGRRRRQIDALQSRRLSVHVSAFVQSGAEVTSTRAHTHTHTHTHETAVPIAPSLNRPLSVAHPQRRSYTYTHFLQHIHTLAGITDSAIIQEVAVELFALAPCAEDSVAMREHLSI